METGAIGGSFSVALSRARDETLAKGVLRTGGRYPPPCPAVLGLSSESPVKASSGRLSVLNGGLYAEGGKWRSGGATVSFVKVMNSDLPIFSRPRACRRGRGR